MWYGDNMMKRISLISLSAWLVHIKRNTLLLPQPFYEFTWNELENLPCSYAYVNKAV